MLAAAEFKVHGQPEVEAAAANLEAAIVRFVQAARAMRTVTRSADGVVHVSRPALEIGPVREGLVQALEAAWANSAGSSA